MAITWEVDSTEGLGSNYQQTVKTVAEQRDYGKLYYAKRISDGAGYHRFRVRTKKWLGLKKYQFDAYTRYNSVIEQEVGAGWSPDVNEI